jgi:hypothetical protein
VTVSVRMGDGGPRRGRPVPCTLGDWAWELSDDAAALSDGPLLRTGQAAAWQRGCGCMSDPFAGIVAFKEQLKLTPSSDVSPAVEIKN